MTEALTRKADKVRLQIPCTPEVEEKRRKLGQFMTPSVVASFMAKMFQDVPSCVRLLDAGAGAGALTAAFVTDVCLRTVRPKSIDVTAFEVDHILADRFEDTLRQCVPECTAHGTTLTWRVIRDDYILHSAEPLMCRGTGFKKYNCAILNPPYAKINTSSRWRTSLRTLGIETSNLYSAFVSVALDQLEPYGQLIAITPRSFCNGSYFEPYRRFMLARAALHGIHVYESRKEAFATDDVLQENIILRLTRGEAQPSTICISSSQGPRDYNIKKRQVPFEEVVIPRDPHMYIRLAVSEEDCTLAARIQSLPCTLRELGITVSTGRVVDFRAKEHLRQRPGPGSVPLIYPCHFERGFISWPRLDSRKPNALAANDQTADSMVPRGTYVLTKRFTSKEEKRRLIAVVYDPQRISSDRVGFENHVNYFHEDGHGLPDDVAKGLVLFLNSTAVDRYFRQFSGHTQVNATDLRSLHYPSRAQLKAAGLFVGSTLPSIQDIDRVVNAILHDVK